VSADDRTETAMDQVREPGCQVPLRLLDRMEGYVRAGRAPNTWRAYASDLRHFEAWCATEGLVPLPAEPGSVAAYLADHAGRLAVSTLARRLAAISVIHQAAGVVPAPTASPQVAAVWAGIRRSHGTAPRKARAARTAQITVMVSLLGDRLIDHRDRALLLLGYSGALRRSELVALDVPDVVEDGYGLRLRLRGSKTDQERAGAVTGLPYGSNPATCPVRAWRTWVQHSGIEEGPAFRPVTRHGGLGPGRLGGRTVAEVVKRRARDAGLAGDWSAHSLRAGFATEGYAQGTPELAIMRHGRWRSATVMRGYVEEGGLWVDNAATRLGL
jgi:site-specific recombinase XerD